MFWVLKRTVMVLLSTHNICFGQEIRKLFFCNAPLTISLNRDASAFLGAREKGYLFIFRELGSTGNYVMGVAVFSLGMYACVKMNGCVFRIHAKTLKKLTFIWEMC